MIKRRLSREEREKEIVEAAKEVFIKKGYLGATTMELAKKANISEVTLFRYFPTKNELFMATVEPIITEAIDQVLKEKQVPAEHLLEEFMRERIHFITSNQELIKLTLIESEMNHELSEEVNVINSIISKITILLERLEVPNEKQQHLLRIIIGSLLAILFLPIAEKDQIEAYISDINHLIKGFLLDFKK